MYWWFLIILILLIKMYAIQAGVDVRADITVVNVLVSFS